jgi:hypothetical protein
MVERSGFRISQEPWNLTEIDCFIFKIAHRQIATLFINLLSNPWRLI